VEVVLVPGPAGQAAGMETRAAHGRDDKISWLEALDGRSGRYDLSQRLVADHQVVVSRRGSPVLEGADLLVRAADADVERLQHDPGRLGDPGSLLLDDLDLAGSREHGDCLHYPLPAMIAPGERSWFILRTRDNSRPGGGTQSQWSGRSSGRPC